ncbi:hypothetical protein [Altericroceibacterium xinjiangense]|uniref:hypothetical protein n=1 Tax=Altericroceibacterium xinjiangense TaxID=762261 RepID=UPI000F7F3AA6|nr:hypothetical protein [Altericroceibacterium xinjiangense]
MASTKWIPLEEAGELLLARRLEAFSGSFVLSYSFVWDLIAERLTSGELPSRPTRGADFKLVLSSAKGEEHIPLNADGLIPVAFWFHYLEAARTHGPIITLNDPSFAESVGSTFRFRQCHGIRDEGVLEGEACDVLVLRAAMPGDLPNPRGRMRGRQQYDDTDIVEKVINAVQNEGRTLDDALAEFSPMMQGSREVTSKRRRLCERLKDRFGEKYRTILTPVT